MHRLILALLLFLTLGACWTTTTEYVYVEPEIPAETLTACPMSARKAKTVKELAVLATEHKKTAECANGKIETVAEIMAKQKTKVAKMRSTGYTPK